MYRIPKRQQRWRRNNKFLWSLLVRNPWGTNALEAYSRDQDYSMRAWELHDRLHNRMARINLPDECDELLDNILKDLNKGINAALTKDTFNTSRIGYQ